MSITRVAEIVTRVPHCDSVSSRHLIELIRTLTNDAAEIVFAATLPKPGKSVLSQEKSMYTQTIIQSSSVPFV